MKIQILDKTDYAMRMLISGVDTSFVNALRRIILAEVPAMAIDEVVIIENSSVLHDEILAHRLGLIPLKTDLDTYNLPEDCPCKSEFGCNLCRVALTLDVEAGEETRTVYSGELKSESQTIVPTSDKIPLVKLAPRQNVKLEAYARLGRGRDHAKWQPVSVCTYKYLPQIKVNAKTCDVCGECVNICPRDVLEKTGKKLEVRKLFDCTLCQDCVDVCPKKPPAIEVTWDKNAFIFNVESSGALLADRIITEAVKILDKHFGEFQKQLAVKKDEEG